MISPYESPEVDMLSYNNHQELAGNADRNTIVTHTLKPFQARWVRLKMTECVVWCCLRWALFG